MNKMDFIHIYNIFEYIELLNALVSYGGGCRLLFPAIKIGGHRMNFGGKVEYL